MDAKKDYWASVQDCIAMLEQEGLMNQAQELQEALDESKVLGEVTIKVAKIQTDILISRADEVAKKAMRALANQRSAKQICS